MLQNICEQEKEIEKLRNKLQGTRFLKHNFSEEESDDFSAEESDNFNEEGTTNESEFESDFENNPYFSEFDISMKSAYELKKLGKKAQETRDKELALTVDRLQDLHKSLVARPSEDEKAEDPRGLNVELMPHQRHALAWLLWREQKKPSGGILGKFNNNLISVSILHYRHWEDFFLNFFLELQRMIWA